MAAAPLSENNGPGAQQKRNAALDFDYYELTSFYQAILVVSRVILTHSSRAAGHCFECVLAAARENQLQCVGIHAAAATWPFAAYI
jgi:hypothetical protein